MGFTSVKGPRFCAFIAIAFLCVAVSWVSANVQCENIYRDFSDCVLELGVSMDGYHDNVTSQRGVEAVCSHWEAFHSCALTALSGCQAEVGSVWETLREDSRQMRFQGSLFDLCSSAPAALAPPPPPLPLLLPAALILTGPVWSPT